MSQDMLLRHFQNTPAPSAAIRERISVRIQDATRRPPPRSRRPRGGAWVALTASVVLLLGGVALAETIFNRHESQPRVVKISAVFALAHPGTPVDLSEFDAKTRMLLRSERVTAAFRLGHAGGLSFYRFTAEHGQSCLGESLVGRPMVVDALSCGSTAGSWLPNPVLDMSTVALDPSHPTPVRLIDVSGIADSDVRTIRVTMTDGAFVDVPVEGDVYALPAGDVPPGVVSTITALSDTDAVLWTESLNP